MIHSKDIREKLKDIDEFLGQEYKIMHPEKKRDWRTYEEQYALRIKEAMTQLKPLVNEAVDSIYTPKGRGAPHALTLKQRVVLLLLQRLFGESNRMMASMLTIFSALSDVEVSYKTVERLYSDEEVEMALHNLHVLILKKKGIQSIDATGDGTGYSLTITKHYASEAQKLKDDAKESDGKIMAFVYSFKLMDIHSWMYVAYGTSMKSEREAYDRAMEMFDGLQIEVKSARLDRYYSCSVYFDDFQKGTRMFVIPKTNATLNGSWKWKRTMIHFVQDTMAYLEQYHQRSKSEAGFSEDKRRLGWNIAQRRPDRIDTADFGTSLWHNMFRLGGTG